MHCLGGHEVEVEGTTPSGQEILHCVQDDNQPLSVILRGCEFIGNSMPDTASVRDQSLSQSLQALTGFAQPAGLPCPEAGLQSTAPRRPGSIQSEKILPSAHTNVGWEVEEDLLHTI
jgi:hypothetical protein